MFRDSPPFDAWRQAMADYRRTVDEERETVLDEPQGEGAAAKLERMRETSRGRQWLREHPHATWEDIEAARI